MDLKQYCTLHSCTCRRTMKITPQQSTDPVIFNCQALSTTRGIIIYLQNRTHYFTGQLREGHYNAVDWMASR